MDAESRAVGSELTSCSAATDCKYEMSIIRCRRCGGAGPALPLPTVVVGTQRNLARSTGSSFSKSQPWEGDQSQGLRRTSQPQLVCRTTHSAAQRTPGRRLSDKVQENCSMKAKQGDGPWPTVGNLNPTGAHCVVPSKQEGQTSQRACPSCFPHLMRVAPSAR